MAKIKRNLIGSYLNTGTLIAPVWSLIGLGVPSGKIAMNPKTESTAYISDENASVSVESYAPTFAIEQIAITTDAVFAYVDALRKSRSVLTSAETEMVTVYLYKTPALLYYLAEKVPVVITTEDFGGDGGSAAKVNYTIHSNGDPVIGEFKPTATATWVSAPVNAKLTTMVIGSVTLTPLFATNKANLHYAGNVTNGTTTVTMTSTLAGSTILQKDGAGATVNQAAAASLNVGVNDLTIKVTVGTEEVTYHIAITRAAS
jgi:hypothetical protein